MEDQVKDVNADTSAAKTSDGKFMTQDDLDRLVVASKAKGREQAEKERAAQSAQTISPAQQQPDFDGMFAQKLVEHDRQKAAELKQAQEIDAKQKLEQKVHESLSKLSGNVQMAKQKHTDFDQVVQDSGLHENLPLALAVSGAPNAGDILYEMGKSPAKLAAFQSLVHSGSVKAAEKYIADLSKSLGDNETASKQSLPKSPLSTIKPTPVGSGSSGNYKGLYKGKF